MKNATYYIIDLGKGAQTQCLDEDVFGLTMMLSAWMSVNPIAIFKIKYK